MHRMDFVTTVKICCSFPLRIPKMIMFPFNNFEQECIIFIISVFIIIHSCIEYL